MICVAAVTALSPAGSHGDEGAAVEAVFCIDASESARLWDEHGGRAAATLLGDALLPEGSRRALVLFSFETRDWAPLETTPLSQRSDGAQGGEATLSHALESPGSDGSSNPVEAVKRALELLAGGTAERKAIFLLLGRRVQIGASAPLSRRLIDLATHQVAQCQIDGVRLYVAHRDASPGMDSLWQDLAGATGGEARRVESGEAMAGAVLDWCASLSGVFSVAQGRNAEGPPGPAGQPFALAFDLQAEDAETARNRIRAKGYALAGNEGLLCSGRFALASLSAPEKPDAAPPIPAERILRTYTRLRQRAELSVHPAIITGSDSWSAVIDFSAFGGQSDPKGQLPDGSVAVLIPSDVAETADSRSVDKSRVVPLHRIQDPRTGASIYKMTVEAPHEPGTYYLVVGPPPGDAPVEYLRKTVRIHPDAVVAATALDTGRGGRKQLILKASFLSGEIKDARVCAVWRRGGAAPEFIDVLPVDTRYYAVIAQEYGAGDVYRVVVGVLGTREDGLHAYVPGRVLDFPPRVTPDRMAALIAQAGASPARVEANLPPTGVPTPHTPPVTAAAPSAGAALTTPVEASAPGTPPPRIATKRDYVFFGLINALLLCAMAWLFVWGRSNGLFPGTVAGLTVPDAARHAAEIEDASDAKTAVFREGLTERTQQEVVHEDALRSALSGVKPRPALSEEELLAPPPKEKETEAIGAETPRQAAAGAKDADAKAELVSPGVFTEEDLLKSLTQEGFTRNDEIRPRRRDLTQQREPLTPGAAVVESATQEDLLAETSAAAPAAPAPPAPVEPAAPAPVGPMVDAKVIEGLENLSDGFLSQEDLDALLAEGGEEEAEGAGKK